jgi:hypothetical protein
MQTGVKRTGVLLAPIAQLAATYRPSHAVGCIGRSGPVPRTEGFGGGDRTMANQGGVSSAV